MNRVLIVDDKEECRNLLRVLLEGHGFQVIEARHVAEAMTLAQSQKPNVVITDLLMPVLDGYTLLQKWKADDQLCSVPIVVYTAGNIDPQDEKLALRLGADAFIRKATESELLLERLRDVLSGDPRGLLPSEVLVGRSSALLNQHNEALVRKLEEKILHLERANQDLVDDVHRRQSVEQELREQKDFLDAVIRHEPECVKVINPDGLLEQINPAGLMMLEASSLAEAQKRVLLDFIPRDQPEHREAYVAFLKRVCALGQAGSLVYPIISCRGTRRWLESHAAPLHDKRRGVSLMLSITRDITERLRLEEELRRAQKMEAIGLLAGGIAHDFNNILGIVLGNAELIESVTDLPPKQKRQLANIIVASKRARDLVKQILAFSRQSETERTVVRFDEVIAEALTLLRSTIPTSISIESKLGAPDIFVCADVTQLHQVVLNLVTNAWQAILDHTGCIQVETSFSIHADQGAEGDDRLTGNYVQLLVCDNGVGIAAGRLGRIFDPFFTTKAPGEGTGLGLAVVHGIVKNHGGEISVRSEIGSGTTFSLRFPILATSTTTAEPADVPLLRGHGEHLLVVDDEHAIAEVCGEVLTRLGYRVTTCTSPLDALEKIRSPESSFALLITDLAMPGITGLQLIDSVRLLRPELPVLLTSGHIDQYTHREIARMRLANVVTKPWTVTTLVRAVQASLHPHHGRAI